MLSKRVPCFRVQCGQRQAEIVHFRLVYFLEWYGWWSTTRAPWHAYAQQCRKKAKDHDNIWAVR